MSQFSFSSFDASLMVRDAKGHYQPATADQILDAARQAIEHKMQRGASFTSPAAVKEYLCTKLGGFEHEVFAVLFLDLCGAAIYVQRDVCRGRRRVFSGGLVNITERV